MHIADNRKYNNAYTTKFQLVKLELKPTRALDSILKNNFKENCRKLTKESIQMTTVLQ